MFLCDIGKDDNRFLTFPILPRIIAIDMRNDYQIQPSNGISDEKLCRLARQGDGPSMENLIRRYTRLVKTCARPYFLAGADAEDLMQEGMLGLLNASGSTTRARAHPLERLHGCASRGRFIPP